MLAVSRWSRLQNEHEIGTKTADDYSPSGYPEGRPGGRRRVLCLGLRRHLEFQEQPAGGRFRPATSDGQEADAVADLWGGEVVEHVEIRRKLIFFFSKFFFCQLFDECLAPNTMGDGTGCDNMTAMIVRLDRFLPQFQEFADSAAMDETSVSTAGSAHPVKRPLNHDNSTDENGDSSSDQPSE